MITTLSSAHCPIPANEPQRIVSLRSYEILDSEPELEFDALARIAAYMFNAPIAVVAMMDSNRLWFKSKIGLEVPQLDRKIAFCSHAVASPDAPLVVNDLASDPRFVENPLVVNAPHLRFYAGAPLLDSAGLALGTIAVIDTVPREMNPAQLRALSDMATLVMTALRGRKRELELKKMALTDYLTGIGNRAQFDLVNSTEMANFMRTGVSYSVICMDLNGFKSINDHYGHSVGDQVLQEVARRLNRQMRTGDLIARIGGDEFAVVARNCDRATAETLAQRFERSLEQPIVLLSGQQVQGSISCGMATSSIADLSASILLEKADQQLYQSKRMH